MQILHGIVLLLHFIGWAALFGGLFVQIKDRQPVVNAAMLHGALTQLVTGLALVGILEAALDEDLNHIKIGVKLLVTIVITVLVIANRRKEFIPKGLWAILLVLTLANAALAVLW
ncbi:hypothetical protein [Enemella sp. A6]|uniref:hypothetical protein n=1 Tax=Enemella sp. A6 TaxID=3440152 RepID=UPI003EB9F16B